MTVEGPSAVRSQVIEKGGFRGLWFIYNLSNVPPLVPLPKGSGEDPGKELRG